MRDLVPTCLGEDIGILLQLLAKDFTQVLQPAVVTHDHLDSLSSVEEGIYSNA